MDPCAVAVSALKYSAAKLYADLASLADLQSLPPPPPPPPPPPDASSGDYALKLSNYLEQELQPWLAEHVDGAC